ncbi:MAG: adenylyltransferase/cytidyltransferase family protein [Verrucomicrobiales bacterium]
MSKTVFVSGCFDLLHSGHLAFLQNAARHGALYVALGSDATIRQLKGRPPVIPEAERLFMVRAVNGVAGAFIAKGSGVLDFERELRELRPDIFIVNEDGNIPQKERLCRELGIQYLVLRREPVSDLPARSTTELRSRETMPYRIDLAGGWLDQPFVSRLFPGPVLTVSLEATVTFNERSGMATSTRNHALELWGPQLPIGDPERLAYQLFCYDNPPGTETISGSQDAIGIVMAGLCRSFYNGAYWPSQIEIVHDETILSFLESSLYLVPLGPRDESYDPRLGQNLTQEGAQALSLAAEACWEAILRQNLPDFGHYFRESFESQVRLFPEMMTPAAAEMVDRHRDRALGWKLSGAGGGGYLIVVAEQPVENALRVRIRRR